jgi:hypothetical protein
MNICSMPHVNLFQHLKGKQYGFNSYFTITVVIIITIFILFSAFSSTLIKQLVQNSLQSYICTLATLSKSSTVAT